MEEGKDMPYRYDHARTAVPEGMFDRNLGMLSDRNSMVPE